MKFCVRMTKNISWCAGFKVLIPSVLRIRVGKYNLMENRILRTIYSPKQDIGVFTKDKTEHLKFCEPKALEKTHEKNRYW